jgi:3-oxoadipate enol-lactonase
VILLHGLGATNESWGFQIPELLRHKYRVLAPDFRGFGKSSYPGGRQSISDLASDIITMMNGADISTANLVGISMGGAIALQLAYCHPDRFNKLVLVNTFANLRPNSLRGWLYFATRFGLVHLLGLPTQARFVANRLFPHPEQDHLRQMFIEQILQANPKGYRATMRSLMSFNLKQQLRHISVDTLVISGENDTTVPLPTQGYLARNIPNACRVIIPGAGHALTVEKPTEFNKILIDFIAD